MKVSILVSTLLGDHMLSLQHTPKGLLVETLGCMLMLSGIVMSSKMTPPTVASGIARLERASVQGYQKGPFLPHTGIVWAPTAKRWAAYTARLTQRIATQLTVAHMSSNLWSSAKNIHSVAFYRWCKKVSHYQIMKKSY